MPDPAGVLDLPPGFSYRVVSAPVIRCPAAAPRPAATTARRRSPAPAAACGWFRTTRSARSDPVPTLAEPELTYDPRAKGGTTTLTLDRH